MGDSPLSNQQPQGGAPPNGSGPTPQQPQPQGGDPQEFMKQLSGAVEQIVQQAVAPISQQVQELESRLQPPQDPPARPNGAGGDSFLDRFVSDPETVLGEFLRKGIQDTMSPYMQTVLSDGQMSAVQAEQRAFDQTYGEGKFKELIQPKLDVVVDNLPEHLRGSREHIKRAVAGIKGSPELESDLFTLRQEKIKADEEAERARPPGFVGPGRPLHLEQGADLSEDDETFLDGLKKSGVDTVGFGREMIQKLRSARTPEERRSVLAPPKPANSNPKEDSP